MNVRIHISDTASPIVQRIVRELGNPEKLHALIATGAEKATRDHIIRQAPERHKTAEGLGADPTGEMTKAAGRVTSESSAEDAMVSVPSYLFRRAFGPVSIRPISSPVLTIPASAPAYGKRAGELRSQGWKIFRPGTSKVLLGYKDKETPIPLYFLASAVTQQQDRTLLPSNDEFAKVAGEAATLYAQTLTR